MIPSTPWAAHPEFALYELSQLQSFCAHTPAVVVYLERDAGEEKILYVDVTFCVKRCSDGQYLDEWQCDNPTHIAVIAYDRKQLEEDFRAMVNKAKRYRNQLLSTEKVA